MHLSIPVLVMSAIAAVVPLAHGADSPRRTLALDGNWQIAEGKLDHAPDVFERTVPVPGLVDMAKPAFDDPGPKVGNRELLPSKDRRRDAFWYRRTFNLDGPIPPVAVLKIGKAMFGSQVILNGKLSGEHAPSFTPGYFDLKDALKTGENDLLIRVCADRDTVTTAIPSGFDFEKERYMPGIFDSVELILSGTPHIINVQAVPDIANKTVRVRTQLRNAGAATQAGLTCVVREAKSGKEVGKTTSAAEPLAAGAEMLLDVRVPIEQCQLWSPESPFLYTLTVETASDRVETRFGMREFKFDPLTRKAMLNGKPYFMRGSNITLYRFFEDPDRGNLPWDEKWVRQLHRQVKEMNWNCLRYCIGFPPEMWYRIADEEGILIQDEFPIWFGGPGWSVWPKALKRDQLVREFTEWMRERWNHPCVVIWDASNETISSETAPAVSQVRALDLSNRPWDNSYSAPLEPGDTHESHPYHFMNSGFKLREIANASPVPQGSSLKNDEKHPVIINEYGWLWLNRDGTPTTLTKDLYKNLLGPNSTAAQRLELYARYLAAETEFWRVHRKVAAVMHFTALGYSRPDGQTSDHWLDIAKLTWEPNFQHHVRDAFAPVGLCVNFWKDQLNIGDKVKIPVILINDLDKPWTGPVTLRVINENLANEKPVVTQASQDCRIEPLGRTELSFDVTLPAGPGRYTIEAELRGAGDQPVHSVRVIECIDPAIALRALGLAHLQPATASSSVTARNRTHAPALAVDGNPATYWSSTSNDPSWLAVDLGAMKKISRVKINWETAFAKAFTIQISQDGKTWTEVYTNAAGQGGINDIRITPVSTRWVRMLGTQRATEWGYAIRELQVFE
jgi:beta-galactosidase